MAKRVLLSFALAAALAGSCVAQSNDLVVQPGTVGSGWWLYQAPGLITNSGSFVVDDSASVTFKAANSIHLEPGFQATAGTATITFHALIDPSVNSVGINQLFGTISGTVTLGGAPLPGVTLNLSHDSTASTTTDSNGYYSFTVPLGGLYIVTPSLAGYNFTPPAQLLNDVTGNWTASFTAAPTIGGTLDPQHPAKDFIRMNGRIIAVQSGS